MELSPAYALVGDEVAEQHRRRRGGQLEAGRRRWGGIRTADRLDVAVGPGDVVHEAVRARQREDFQSGAVVKNCHGIGTGEVG